MSIRLNIILTFVTVMAVIFHGRLFAQWYIPLVYIQIATTTTALVLLVWRSYVWIDYGNNTKWYYDKSVFRRKVGFQEQEYIKFTGWFVFLTTLTSASLGMLGKTWIDSIIFTHIPLVLLAIEFFIPYKHLMPIKQWQAIQAAQESFRPHSSNAYQANPVPYQQLNKKSSFLFRGKN